MLVNHDTRVRVGRVFGWLPKAVDTFGGQALFYAESIRLIPHGFARYCTETVRLIAEMALGADHDSGRPGSRQVARADAARAPMTADS